MKPTLVIALIVVGFVLIDLSWQTISFLASSLIFSIGRAAYEHAAHPLGL
jgi:hypothetical protein